MPKGAIGAPRNTKRQRAFQECFRAFIFVWNLYSLRMPSTRIPWYGALRSRPCENLGSNEAMWTGQNFQRAARSCHRSRVCPARPVLRAGYAMGVKRNGEAEGRDREHREIFRVEYRE